MISGLDCTGAGRVYDSANNESEINDFPVLQKEDRQFVYFKLRLHLKRNSPLRPTRQLLQLSACFAPLKKKRSRAQGVKTKTDSGCSISCLFKFVRHDMQIHQTAFPVTTSLD